MAGELQAANLELATRLEAAQARASELEAQLASSSATGRLTSAARLSSPLVLGALLLLLVAAFGGGAYLTDYLARRRHGGFRI